MNQQSRKKEVNHPQIVIDSVGKYVEHVLDNQRTQSDMIYRGHASVDWDLKPGIGRNNYSRELEQKVFEQFKMKYYSYTSERPLTDMDVMFLAQHYGLPTRLLDWSYNPMIALYFACESHPEVDGCIYTVSLREFLVVDSESDMNAPRTMKDIMSMKKPMYVVPNYTDERYKNQSALFLLCNKPEKKFTSVPLTYVIKKEAKEQIIKDLALLGYDRTLVFPMLDSLCKDIKKRLGLEIND